MVCQISTNLWNRTLTNKKIEIDYFKIIDNLSDVGYAIYWYYKAYKHLKAIHKICIRNIRL